MKTKISLIIALFFTLSACNNWLDIELDNKVEDSKLFSTPEGFEEALAGIYSSLSKQNMFGQTYTMEYIDVLAQYYSYSSIKSTYEYWKDYNYQNSGSKSTIAGIWNNLYSNISQANCILEWADKNASVLSESQRNQIRGEALGLRAFLHFEVYRMFSPDVKRAPKSDGIPYNKEFGVSLPPMYSVEETIQLIINDLKEAEQCLQNDPIEDVVPYEIRTTTDQGEVIDAAAKDAADQYLARINLYSVKALLARAYQARGENDLAIQKAQEVIDCGKFRLLEFSSIDQSEALTDLTFSDEHIFSLRNSEIDTYAEKLFQDIVSSNGAITQTALPFSNASTLYQGNNDDVRYSKWFNQGNFVKFIPDSTNVYPQKMPVIKLSEMYLLITECSYNTDPDKALEYLNTLRDHRIRGNVHWTYLTKDYIYEEMRREYVGEGQMWYVYKRNNLTIPGGLTGTIEPTEDMFIFPLPDAEIEDGHRTQR